MTLTSGTRLGPYEILVSIGARDLSRELKRVDAGETTPSESTPTIAPQRPTVWQRPVLAIAALVAIAVVALRWTGDPAPPAPGIPAEFILNPSPAPRLAAYPASRDFAISPDGTQVVYVAEREGARVLMMRQLGQLSVRELRGTEGARTPFFSPDGEWVAFNADGQLRKILLAGGAPTLIGDIGDIGRVVSATWSDDDTIVFNSYGIHTSLLAISAMGGDPQPLIDVTDTPKLPVANAEFLPGGQIIVHTVGFLPSFLPKVSRHRSDWTDRAPSCLREADPKAQSLRALKEEAISADLDPGELSALALWREHPDYVLLCDDLAARRTAERLGCEIAGTLGVVLWAAQTGRLGAEEARTLIRAIPTQTTLHVRAHLIEQVAVGLDDA